MTTINTAYAKKVRYNTLFDQNDLDYFIYNLLLKMQEAEPTTVGTSNKVINEAKVDFHKTSNLNDANIDMLITFALIPENTVDYHTITSHGSNSIYASYRFYLTMTSGDRNQLYVKQAVNIIIKNLTDNYSKFEVTLDSGIQYGTVLSNNRLASQPIIVPEFEDPAKANYITGTFEIQMGIYRN